MAHSPEHAVDVQLVTERKTQWLIWFVPLIALSVTVWLGWTAWQERGIEITVIFPEGQGIVPGRTLVRYNGLQVGIVESAQLQEDLKGVRTTLSMDKELKEWLTDNTEFWLVQPEISLAGISGLDTLFSGNYVTINPARGKPQTTFHARAQPPPLAEGKEGLHIVLRADNAGSLISGSPVSSIGLTVGEVEQVAMGMDDNSVEIKVFIRPEYAHLVTTATNFWNVSGVDISGPISRLKIHVESLLTLIKGGIAFATPDWAEQGEALTESTVFKLHKNYEDAQLGIPIEITFPLGEEIVQMGSRLMFYGIDVGVVRSFKINENLKTFVVHALITPLAEPLLVSDARFWLVDTKFTSHGIEGLDALINGPYIAVEVSAESIKTAQRTTSFQGTLNKPPPAPDAPGLHLRLLAKDAIGLHEGNTVSMRGITVGRVESVTLQQDGVEGFILIKPQYQHLIRSNTRFWNASGISLAGNINGFQFDSRPFSAIWNGSVECETPEPLASPVHNRQTFSLYPNRKQAFAEGKVFNLLVDHAPMLDSGAPVYYRGIQVGEVSSIGLSHNAKQVLLRVRIDCQYTALVTKESRFWNVSGIRGGFSFWHGLSVQMESATALIKGGIAFATPNPAPPAKRETFFSLHKQAEKEWLRWNPAIVLPNACQHKKTDAVH